MNSLFFFRIKKVTPSSKHSEFGGYKQKDSLFILYNGRRYFFLCVILMYFLFFWVLTEDEHTKIDRVRDKSLYLKE